MSHGRKSQYASNFVSSPAVTSNRYPSYSSSIFFALPQVFVCLCYTFYVYQPIFHHKPWGPGKA